MDILCAAYRALTSRAGKAEPLVHVSLLIYAALLFGSFILNALAPSWVTRHTFPPAEAVSSSLAHLYPGSLDGAGYNAADGRAVARCVTHGLLTGVDDDVVVQRVRTEMECGCARHYQKDAPGEYTKVAAIVQSFNHARNVERIAAALKSNFHIDEIIVCEDGSTDGSLDRWTEALNGSNHFIILSNNLHEVRCYNRAMRASSAEFFILLQDDDLPPALPEHGYIDIRDDRERLNNWVVQALTIFDSDERLGVLSGFIGQLWQNGKGYEFGEQTSDHGGQRQGHTFRIPFLHPNTSLPFMYCECAWAAPLFVRAKALRRVGGLDIGLFGVREPGVWQDCVLSYAAWTAGWRVGVYDSKFQRGVGGHGSTRSPDMAKMREVVWQRAKDACDTRYDRQYIHSHVVTLNNQTLDSRF